MRLFVIRIIICTIIGMGGGIVTCMGGNWFVGSYLIGWVFGCCYDEIKTIINNGPAYIEYRIKYSDKKI